MTAIIENVATTRRRQHGVTLIELMIVAAIIAILSAFAYPAYQEYVIRAKRTVAQNTLLQVADRQQQFFMDNKQFADDMTDLGYAADPYVVGDDGVSTVAGDAGAVYSLSFSNVTATTWTATSSPAPPSSATASTTTATAWQTKA